ncbi:MAG: Cro/CI family transcriptional regulator [Gammaproteobacteria bacterium]
MESSVKSAVQRLIDHFGGQASTATAVGVKQPTISAWLNNGHGISARNALKAERVTKGAVKAVDLCPDLSPEQDEAA